MFGTELIALQSLDTGGRELRTLAAILTRMGNGGRHVDIKLSDGTKLAGELAEVATDHHGRPYVRLNGPDAPESWIPVESVVRMTRTPAARCAYCTSGLW